jgi:hypothetical protein
VLDAQLGWKRMNTKDDAADELDDDIPEEVDFSNAVRSKHADYFDRNTVMVLLAPDVARVFPDADAVNEALRLLIKTSEHARAS